MKKPVDELMNQFMEFFIEKGFSNIKIGGFDTVVVDPPRSGLSKKVINNLLNKKCKRIVYVSCNPKTLYKDIKLLEESYKVISLTPFNMFPKTKHIETVCLLEKINNHKFIWQTNNF